MDLMCLIGQVRAQGIVTAARHNANTTDEP